MFIKQYIKSIMVKHHDNYGYLLFYSTSNGGLMSNILMIAL